MTTTTPKPRVVVADDSALMRRIVTNVLTKGGIDVVGAAKDGDEALALCEREQPDAMTLDLAMPGLGGIDVLKALRQRGGPAIPVVVVSAFSPAHGAYAVDALAEGAFELVPKPSGQADVDAFEQNLLTKILVATKTRRLGGHLRSARLPRDGNGANAVAAGVVGSASTNGHVPVPPRVGGDPYPQRRLPRAADRHLHRRPAGAGRGRPRPALPAGAGHHDRAAHARRLHRLAGRPPGSLQPAHASARPRAASPWSRAWR